MVRRMGTAPRYRGRMRHLLWILVRTAIVIVVVAVVRAILLDRAPQRALNGAAPVIGSLDTWPAVPRKPVVPTKG
jgi:hypothetical protein